MGGGSKDVASGADGGGLDVGAVTLSSDGEASAVRSELVFSTTGAHPTFVKPEEGAGTEVDVAAVSFTRGATDDLATLIPLAAAIFRNSFSSRRRSFSLILSSSSCGFMRRLLCMSRKRALWWCAYEFVCSSYCETFLNCLSQSWQ